MESPLEMESRDLEGGFHKFGWVKPNKCKIGNGPGTDKHRLYECIGWPNVKLQSKDEVRCYEQIARTSAKQWLWERSIASFPGADLIDREVEKEQVSISASGCRRTP